MADPAQKPPPSDAGPNRLKFGKWRIVRALKVLLILLLVILIAGEIVFFTDLPRNIMVNALQKQLGLRVSAKSLSTGWLGYTTLRDVTLTLPLADKAFVNVPVLKINHSWLPTLIFGGSLTIHEISIENARLDVIQEPRGSWNLQEVVQLIGRTGGSKNADQSTRDITLLPALNVIDATLVVTDNNHRSATIEHLAVTGNPNGPLLWEYHATIPDRLDLTGKVAPGGIWAHEITLGVHNVDSWTAPWISSWPPSATLQAHWIGQITGGQLVGRIDLDKAEFGNISISGPIQVTATGDTATLRPAGLLVASATSRSLDTRLQDGQIIVDAGGLESQQLALELAGGNARVNGKFTFGDNSASLHAAWRDVALPAFYVQSGDVQFQYTPTLGQPRFNAILQSHGSLGSGQLNAQLAVDGTGNSLKSISFVLTTQKFRLDTPKFGSVDLTGLVAQVNSYPKGLLLQDLHLGHSHPLSGQGGYSIDDRTAWLSLSGRALPIPGEPANTLDADLNIWANSQRIHLEQIFLRFASLSAYLNGDYVYNLPKPLKAHAYLIAIPPLASANAPPQPFRGSFLGNIDLNGTVAPMDLALTGSAVGQNIHIGQRPIGDLGGKLLGTFRDNEISIGSRDIQLLGGNWAVHGRWPAKNNAFRIDNLAVEHLSIPQVLATDDVAGTIDGKWTVDIAHPSADAIEVNGSATISNLVIGNPQRTVAAQYLTCERIQLPSTKLQSGQINLAPITLVKNISPPTNPTTAPTTGPSPDPLPGRASASLATSLRNPQQFSIGVNINQWPVKSNAIKLACLLSGKASLQVDLNQKAADGHADLSADTSWDSKSTGQVQASIDVNHRKFVADDIKIQSLGGTALGRATYDIDNPYQARLNLSWKDIDLAGVSAFTSILSPISGKVNGSLDVQPATTPRPLEPLAISLQIVPNNVHLKAFPIGQAQAAAFLGPSRFVLDDSPDRPTQVAIAGGLIHFWGRVSCYDGPVYQSLLEITLENLDLNAVLPAGAKSARHMPGVLSGQITVVGRPRFPNLAFGQGFLTLEKSDLAGASSIAFLYNLMHIGHDANKPTGSGRLDFTIQNQGITITAMRYFDKNVEVRLAGQIDDILHLPHSPIALTVVGSARPLKTIGLPDFADIDIAFGAIQNDALNIQITGYLDKPKQREIPFAALGQDMQSFLFGDAQSATNGE